MRPRGNPYCKWNCARCLGDSRTGGIEARVGHMHRDEQIRVIERLMAHLDNGPEMTSKAMFFWSQRHHVTLHCIQPGKPTQNAFVESFNGQFRDYCLNQQYFLSLTDARLIIDQWRDHYNRVKPHSSLGYQPPALFEERVA